MIFPMMLFHFYSLFLFVEKALKLGEEEIFHFSMCSATIHDYSLLYITTLSQSIFWVRSIIYSSCIFLLGYSVFIYSMLKN